MFIEPVCLEEVTNIFEDLKNSAPGHDELTPSILRSCFPTIKEPLVHILKLSLAQWLFPAELKIANVLHVYKADDNMVFNNYRSVSLLCILSKVLKG